MASELVSTNVAVSLYNGLKEGAEKSENIFFSPFSIAVALSMVKHGARGESLQQLHSLLSKSGVADAKKAMKTIRSVPDGIFKVTTANRAWVQKSFHVVQDYIDFLENDFSSTIIPADFANDFSSVAGEINSWVANETNDKIKDLVDPGSLNALTRLVLVNAVYFKGRWKDQFEAWRTKPRDFYLTSSKKIQADFMYQKEHMKYGQLDNCQVVGLPYKTPAQISAYMYVIVPNKVEGLAQIESNLEKIVPKLDSLRSKEVELYLPKFKFEQKTDLAVCLKRLGVSHLFERRCDLSGINDQLFVSKMIHQALIEVNEAGTKASAATRADGAERELFRGPRVNADRPFMFFIIVNGCVLFSGRLCSPEVAKAKSRKRSYSSESSSSSGTDSDSESGSSGYSYYSRRRYSSTDSGDSDYRYIDRRRLSCRTSSRRSSPIQYADRFRNRSPYYPRYIHRYNYNNYYSTSYYRSSRPYYEPQYRRQPYRELRSTRDRSPERSRYSYRRRSDS